MAAQSGRIDEGWEHDADISMIDLGGSEQPETPTHLAPGNFHRRQTSDSSSESPRPCEDTSTKSLLHKSSYTSTASFENVESPQADRDGTRLRHGFRSNIQQNLHQLWARRPLLRQGTTSTFEGHFAHGKPGLWHKQMLVDRSLRSMAAFTAVCAIAMFIVVFSYLSDFAKRLNPHSTSVGGNAGESCSIIERKNVAIHLFVNIAATMILGCSNTYQQLVTALKVDEIRWVMSRRGDSRVGTNSPWAINHKRGGKLKAWSAWILLISTSIPVHFLANSVIGPSFYVHTPTKFTWTLVDSQSQIPSDTSTSLDSGCWTAFRANSYVLPPSVDQIQGKFYSDTLGNSTTYASAEIFHTANCTQYIHATNVDDALTELNKTSPDGWRYSVGPCDMGTDVACVLGDEQPKQCRMNVRMQAAFILAGCLFIKAAYMVVLNYRARRRTKNHCLAMGDVVVASVLDRDLKIKNECLLNSGDGYRSDVAHTCHKHCKDPEASSSGDNIGHCQKCKKFNVINKAADLPHPSIAIKYKRSLLSNLGSTAITQMLILMLTSLAMLATSIMLIVGIVSTVQTFNSNCYWQSVIGETDKFSVDCKAGIGERLKQEFGTWGGFSSSATFASLTTDSLGSEFTAFAISNGAQFLYSLLYLLLIYNLTLISMEHEWGEWETKRKRPRCTIVSGRPFEQSYFLQLPSRLLLPLMGYAALMHWLLGQAISAIETVYTDPEQGIEHSVYFVTYAAYPIFMSTALIIAMTVVCWWAFTYTREGFIPQMYGSIRTLCASTTELTDFNPDGILWGDLGMGESFRHAGFSSDEPGKIVPAELYCGRD